MLKAHLTQAQRAEDHDTIETGAKKVRHDPATTCHSDLVVFSSDVISNGAAVAI
jgi:hypothetical protein